MKNLIMIAITLISISGAFASECEKMEAQIIAEIVEVKTDSLTYCKAMVSEKSISHFREHFFCPLLIEEVVEQGISFPLTNGHDCVVPEKIGGYILLGENGIELE